MPTITGTLQAPDESAIVGGVEVMLCGYGSQVPRIGGAGLGARITQEITVAIDGTFSFDVIGNDEIAPAGTYYTVTIKDDNGDISQVNAYQFLSDESGYDLNTFDPYDPDQPPSPLPPPTPPTNQILPIPFTPTPVFTGDTYTAFRITLGGNVTSSTIVGQVPGNLYTFIIQQDSSGTHTFAWPANMYNASPISQDPNEITIQTFIVDNNLNLYAIAGATYYP